MTARDDYPLIAVQADEQPFHPVITEYINALAEIDDLRERLEDAEAYIHIQEGITS